MEQEKNSMDGLVECLSLGACTHSPYSVALHLVRKTGFRVGLLLSPTPPTVLGWKFINTLPHFPLALRTRLQRKSLITLLKIHGEWVKQSLDSLPGLQMDNMGL